MDDGRACGRAGSSASPGPSDDWLTTSVAPVAAAGECLRPFPFPKGYAGGLTWKRRLCGMIVRSDGPQVTVRAPDGVEWRCVLRGRLRKLLVGATNPVAVGDRVEVQPLAPGDGVVESVLPRR